MLLRLGLFKARRPRPKGERESTRSLLMWVGEPAAERTHADGLTTDVLVLVLPPSRLSQARPADVSVLAGRRHLLCRALPRVEQRRSFSHSG